MQISLIVLIGFRWLHVTAGVLWLGIAYYLNLVNAEMLRELDRETKRLVVPRHLPRALWWFRWGAAVTVISGWMFAGHLGGVERELMKTVWAKWIGVGALVGTFMALNAWFIIWPAQKKLITWIARGEAPGEMAGLAARTALWSRINLYLSVPLLFTMVAARHYHDFGPGTLLAVFLIGAGAMHGMLVLAPRVGHFPEGGYPEALDGKAPGGGPEA